ncbi:MAG: tRNA (N6-isopentenyl adenosine(37)-C2)-methylthiotransferase MiaB [bacterium]
MPKKIFIHTLGCQMNERDSEQAAAQFQQRGYKLVKSETEADVILLNTCSVRDFAEQKAIRKMENLRALKRRNPRLILGFLGCMAQSRGRELLEQLPEVDLVLGTQRLHHLADHVDALLQNGKKIVDVASEENAQNAVRDHLLAPKQATAFVSIMQGCDMRCSFCIVPSTRGRQRSRPMNDILAEIRALTAQGVREVTLLGQIVNRYGFREFPVVNKKTPFVQLLYALEKIKDLARVRFASPHPIGMTDDLAQAFRELKKLCSHTHLPLQSGSDAMLKKMKRGYTAAQYRKTVDKLRAARPDIAFTTDIIVGFPGETEKDFLQTYALVEEVAFDNAFIFKYSPRKDTPAASMTDQIPQEIKEQRNLELLRLIDRIAAPKSKALKGTTVEVLVEGPSKNNPARLSGRTSANKIVIFEGGEQHYGKLLPVRIEDATEFTLYGKLTNLN